MKQSWLNYEMGKKKILDNTTLKINPTELALRSFYLSKLFVYYSKTNKSLFNNFKRFFENKKLRRIINEIKSDVRYLLKEEK